MSIAAASPMIDDAVDSGLGALLVDRDVTEISSLEGGAIEVLRRGKREKIDAILEGPLFALLRESGGEKGLVQMRLRAGPLLTAAPLVDGRIAVRIVKAPTLDATLDALVQSGLLPQGIGEELVAAVLEGAGVVALGPSRTGRQKIVGAIARALQGRQAFFSLTDASHAIAPAALDRMSSTVERARAAVALGADALLGLELSAQEMAALVKASLGTPIVASLTSTSMDALRASADGVDILAFGQAAVVGHGPDGLPRLVELHGPARTTEQETPDLALASTFVDGDTAPITPYRKPVAPQPAAATVVVDEQLPQLGELPQGWKSESPDDDPGWELGGDPPAPGSFDEALAKQRDSTKPTFQPRPPKPHPQAAKLKGDPFGGLTFEPPPGGPVDDEER